MPVCLPGPVQVNKKTRTSAYQLLVDIAHELDDARPLTVSGAGVDSDDEMGDGDAQGGELAGGLIDFVNAVMAGLVGASPHMQVRWIWVGVWGLGCCQNAVTWSPVKPGASPAVLAAALVVSWAAPLTCPCPVWPCLPACLVVCAVCCRAGPVAPGV